MCHFYETIVNGYFQYHSEADHTKQIGFYNNGRPIKFNGNQSLNGTCNIFFKHTIKETRKFKQKSPSVTTAQATNNSARRKDNKKTHNNSNKNKPRDSFHSRLLMNKNKTICNDKIELIDNVSNRYHQKGWFSTKNKFNFSKLNNNSSQSSIANNTQTMDLIKKFDPSRTEREIIDLHHSLNNICSINCSSKNNSIKKSKRHRHRHGRRIVLK